MIDLLILALDLAPSAIDVPESPGLRITTVRAGTDDSLWEHDAAPAERRYLVELVESNAGDVQFNGRGVTLDAAVRDLLAAMLVAVDRRASHPAVAAARAALTTPETT